MLAVKVKDCPEHEEGHSVFLAPTISMDGGMAAEQAIVKFEGDELIRALLKIYVTHGATGWDLHDEEGNDLPFSVEALLADWSLSRQVADRAASLYSEAIFAPFQTKPAGQSPTGRTRRTTSRRTTRTR